MIRWNEVTAILGGRFDPPHVGHREVVRGLFKNPGIGRALIIPTAHPPHKPAVVSAQDRFEMTEINFSAVLHDPFPKEVEISRVELNRSERNPLKPSYTYDTLLELRQSGQQKLAFVLGADQLSQLDTWYRFPEVLGLCHWIIIARKPNGEDLAGQTLAQWEASGLIRKTNESNLWETQNTSTNTILTLVATDAPAVSSTDIRQAIARYGAAPEKTLLPEVEAYLKLRQLYGI